MSSHQQLPAGGENGWDELAAGSKVPHPPRKALSPREQPSNQLPAGVNGNHPGPPGFSPFARGISSSIESYNKIVLARRPQRVSPLEQPSNGLPGVNDNQGWDETYCRGPEFSPFVRGTKSPHMGVETYRRGPGFSPFVRGTKSPHMGVEPYNDGRNETYPPSRGLPRVNNNRGLNETYGPGPGFSPFVRGTRSPYTSIDPYNELVAPLPEHTAVRPLLRSSYPLPESKGNHELSETYSSGPGLSPFVRGIKSPCTGTDPFDRTDNGSSTSIPSFHDDLVATKFLTTLNRCVVCLSGIECPQITLAQIRGLARKTTVKQLHLSKIVTVPETTTIYDARCHMAAHKAIFLVLTDSNGLLSGILTHKEFEAKVIDTEIDLVNTPVAMVMRKNPIFVSSDTLAVEALQKMVEGEVAQLPVIENGKVIALFRLRLCISHFKENAETTAKKKVVEAAMQTIAQWNLDLDAHSEN